MAKGVELMAEEVMVIGGGLAGEAAYHLAEQGIRVHLLKCAR